MSKNLGNIIKLTFSLGLGVLIVWLTTRQLTSEQIDTIKNIFTRADYRWVIIGPVIGLFSNVVRAERWKMLLDSIGYAPKRSNVIYSVFVMYAGNLLFMRLGEVTRCSLLYKTDHIPIDKSIGTMALERVVDMVTILLIGVLLMFFQYKLLFDLLNTTILAHYSETLSGTGTVLILCALAALGLGGLYLLYRLRHHSLIGRVWQFVRGIFDGLYSIGRLNNPLLFIFYSILIWVMYFLMIFICFRALPETASLNMWAGLACLFFGGFAFIVSQGGIGAYPATVGAVLVLYHVAFEVGFAFGWLVWSLQTAGVIIMGVLALMLISRNFSLEQKN
jgi:uncharacterized membrane protein YbhN (UPF0104 family)